MQPFVQLGLRLQRDGHRVRLATHACFRDYVEGKGLEFYPLAGDPLKLSEFMVKTGGFVIPTTPELLMQVRGCRVRCCVLLLNSSLHLRSSLAGAHLPRDGGGDDVLLLGRLRGPRPARPSAEVLLTVLISAMLCAA